MGVGHVYNTTEAAAAKINASLERELTDRQILEISERAKRFSPEVFKEWIRKVVQSDRTPTPPMSNFERASG